MQHIMLVFYFILLLVAAVTAIYSLFYKREVYKIEQQTGIFIPFGIDKLLIFNVFISIVAFFIVAFFTLTLLTF